MLPLNPHNLTDFTFKETQPTMTTPTVVAEVESTAQAFLALILKDALTAGAQPLLTFLAAFGSAAGDPIKIEAAWVAFRGAEIGQLPAFEAALSAQIAAALTARVQALVAKVA